MLMQMHGKKGLNGDGRLLRWFLVPLLPKPLYLSFDAAEVIEQVNKPDKCIDIKDEGYPHLGLWYLFDINDEFTLIEVTTTILELSSFFQRNEGGVVVPL